jgi:hypothetical protein
MKARLMCLVRRHQWHNGWDTDRHETVWTCKRCGAKILDSRADERTWIELKHIVPSGLLKRGTRLKPRRPETWSSRRDRAPPSCPAPPSRAPTGVTRLSRLQGVANKFRPP